MPRMKSPTQMEWQKEENPMKRKSPSLPNAGHRGDFSYPQEGLSPYTPLSIYPSFMCSHNQFEEILCVSVPYCHEHLFLFCLVLGAGRRRLIATSCSPGSASLSGITFGPWFPHHCLKHFRLASPHHCLVSLLGIDSRCVHPS